MNLKPHIFYRDGRWHIIPGLLESMTFYAWEWAASQRTSRAAARVCPAHGDAHGLSWCDICGRATR